MAPVDERADVLRSGHMKTWFGFWRDPHFVEIKNLGRVDRDSMWGATRVAGGVITMDGVISGAPWFTMADTDLDAGCLVRCRHDGRRHCVGRDNRCRRAHSRWWGDSPAGLSHNDLDRRPPATKERGPPFASTKGCSSPGGSNGSRSRRQGFPWHSRTPREAGDPIGDLDNENVIVNAWQTRLVVSGCSNASVIVVVRNAQLRTGERRVAGLNPMHTPGRGAAARRVRCPST